MDDKRIFCAFTIGGAQYLGDLVINGEQTNLTLKSRSPIPFDPEAHSLFGESMDHDKISLYDCVGNRPAIFGHNHKAAYTRDVFPHYTLISKEHVSRDAAVFSSVSFELDDLSTTLSKPGNFGVVPITPDILISIAKEFSGTPINIGPHPVAFYFSGSTGLIEVDLSIGKFSSHLEFSGQANDYSGISCPSKAIAKLEYASPKKLDSMIDDISSIRDFISIIAGRHQEVSNISAQIINPAIADELIDASITWSLSPKSNESQPSSTRDMPVSLEANEDMFRKVFQSWIERCKEWFDARLRIIDGQKNHRAYDLNRLIAAANAYDLIPINCFDGVGILTPDFEAAKDKCKEIIKTLPSSQERDQVLSTLKFWGSKLRDKILSRSAIVNLAFDGYFTELDAVLVIALKTRNYFVHGSDSFGYAKYSELLPFITDTLEFTFIASDLIECGWDARSWARKHPGYSHPMAIYFNSYRRNITEFKEAKLKEISPQ